MKLLLETMLKYPQKIYARERKGYIEMKKYCENIQLSPDMVLSYREKIKMEDIYRPNRISEQKKFYIEKGTVALIPSIKLAYVEPEMNERVIKMYEEIVERLINYGHRVCILAHSLEDSALCKQIYTRIEDKSRGQVLLCNEDFDCLRMEEVISNFSFLITSRYHSIVHAYRVGVPCIAFGWAQKYKELMAKFNQSEYYYNIRNGLTNLEYEDAIIKMLKQYKHESKIITERMNQISHNDIYNFSTNL